MRCSGNVLVQEACWIGWIRNWARGAVLTGQNRNRSSVAGIEALGRAISRERIGWAMHARLWALGLALKRNRCGWAVCTGPVVMGRTRCWAKRVNRLEKACLGCGLLLPLSYWATSCWAICSGLDFCCCCLAVPRPEDGRDLPRHPPLLLRPGGVPRSRLLRLNGGPLRLQCLQIMSHQVEDNEPGDEQR
ncbi:hypothetical protein M9H77_27655 [Catharanthus roseus]|uniref:Uncharacterized protein n=1 Tax=Catharanthus roseus TaxID=4058 RepID=A0ACC0AFT2_CATRO|nr:hypothetical protein M9H77_27655 [Catharanthus roseus]